MNAPEKAGEELLLNDVENRDEEVTVLPPSISKHTFIPGIPKMYWFFYRKPLYFLIFLPSFSAGFIMIQAYVYMGRIVDALKEEDPYPLIKYNALMTFGACLICAVLNFLNFTMWIQLGSMIGMKIKRVLFKSLMEKDIEFYDRKSIGDILYLLNDESASVEYIFSSMKSTQVKAIGQLCSAVFVSAGINLELTLLSVSITVIISVILRYFRRQGGKHMRARSVVESIGLTVFTEIISNPRVAYANLQEENELDRYHHVIDESANHLTTMHYIFFIAMEYGRVVNHGTWALILSLGGFLIMNAKITAGDLLALMRATRMEGFELSMLMGQWNRETRAMESADRIWEVVLAAPKVDPSQGLAPNTVIGDIEFKNVWFKYPTRDAWVLKNVSFKVKSGEIAAFVGHSGSGKSTIVQLLLRYYDVNEGQILVDGRDIKDYSPAFLHRNIGVVQQDSALFTLTVKENLKYGAPDATDREVEQAAIVANADKFIRKLPNGYDSAIGEKGSNLSGGQRQRLAIARAVVKDPRILITDEATAALDAVSEKKVQAALENVMKGRTSIIVAHRLGTIRKAQMIYVFDAGEMVEFGTHEQLIEKKGHYYDLVKLQLDQ